MPYTQLFYHLVWRTKGSQPFLVGEVESMIHNLLRSKAVELGGMVFALNGVEDHVHMVVSIPPAISVADFVGKVKGASSAIFNKTGFSKRKFYWQVDYGAFSFDRKRLPDFVAYVQNQKLHHNKDTAIPALEKTARIATAEVRENETIYASESESWRRELLAAPN